MRQTSDFAAFWEQKRAQINKKTIQCVTKDAFNGQLLLKTLDSLQERLFNKSNDLGACGTDSLRLIDPFRT